MAPVAPISTDCGTIRTGGSYGAIAIFPFNLKIAGGQSRCCNWLLQLTDRYIPASGGSERAAGAMTYGRWGEADGPLLLRIRSYA